MNVYRGIYYATLVGAISGLVAWALATLASVPLSSSGHTWLPDFLSFVFFGLLTGVLLYIHFDRTLLGKMRGSSIGYGLLFGGLSAAVATGLGLALQSAVAATSAPLYRIATWALCFSLISLGLGLRWFKTNRARVLHTYIGGLAGGLLGGLLFVLFAPHAAGMAMCGLMFAGAGTGFGAGIAPILVRDGALAFISSGDARAQNKLGKAHKKWDLDQDESYVIGSAMTTQGGTRFQQGADICVPDSAIAPRHAVVFSKEGRYYIARHPDASGPENIAKYVLRIKGKTIVSSQELHPSDDLLIGRTAMRFDSRKQGE